MKWKLICCVISWLFFMNGPLMAQQIDAIQVHLKISRKTPVQAILKQVEQQIPYRFIYDPGQLDKNGRQIREGEFTIRLDHLLLRLGFRFLIEGRDIILKPGRSGEVSADAETGEKDPPMRILDEVYVVGYGSLESSKVSSALSQVKADQFFQGGVSSPLDLIRGQVAGLSVTRIGGNNDPNQLSSVQLRGVTTLSTYEGANQPLIVVDGVPGGSLDLLQQDDIASFDILKDGSAAAIYGTRGNAGVILISTKIGEAGKTSFEYSSYVSTDKVRKRPKMLDAAAYRALMHDPENPYRGLMLDYGADEDYYSALLNTHNYSTYQYIAASGGTEKNTYRASAYWNKRQGIAKQNESDLYGGRVSVVQRGMKDKFSFQANLAFSVRNANLNGGAWNDFGQAVQQNPTQPFLDSTGHYFYTRGSFSYYNPIARLNQQQYTSETQIIAGDAKINYFILPQLTASINVALKQNKDNEDQYYEQESKASIDNYTGGGYRTKLGSSGLSRTLESLLKYDMRAGRYGDVDLLFGYAYQDETNTNFSIGNAGFLSDQFALVDIGTGNYLVDGKASMSSYRGASKLIAFFSRWNYTYSDKFVASLIFRREGSSRFGANHKWGSFPAISFAWNIEKEPFMKTLTAVDRLKIRWGYGETGNQTIPPYQSLVTLGTGGQYLNNGTWFQTYGPNKNPNPDLRWEKKKEINLGLDFSLFKEKISGNIDVYRRLTSDLLANYNTQVPSFVLPTIYTNVGNISNKGVELTLNINAVSHSDWIWKINVLGSLQRNKLTKLSDNVFKASYFQYGYLEAPGSLGYTIRAEEGKPLGSFYGKRFAGFTDDGKWLFYKADGSLGTTAEMTTDDLRYIGNGVPKYMLSLGSTWQYRNIGLSVFFRGKFDYSILNTKGLYYGNKRWIGNNVLEEAFTKYNALNDDPQYSDYYLERGDFLKLDNVTLSYDFNWHNKAIRKFQLYFAVQNVAVITGYSGLDPEVEDNGLTTGIDSRSFYPPTRTFTLGTHMEF